MWVVKLGGSLAGDARLRAWVSALADLDRPVVIVPGGGPFADQVRDSQRRWGFADALAHHMALLAMEQFGLLLCGLDPRLQPVADPARFGPVQAAGRTPVWLGSAAVLADPELAANWAVTSDSLAAWLADRCAARGLLLVKSAPLDGAEAAVDALQSRGILDAAFDRWAGRLRHPVWLAHKAHADRLPALLDGAAPALRVVFAPAGAQADQAAPGDPPGAGSLVSGGATGATPAGP